MLTGLSVFWFEQTADIVANHLVSATDGVPAEVRGRALRVREARDAAGRVRRARLHHRLGLEGLPGHRLGLRDRAARRAAGVRAAARADLHAVDQGRGRPRRGDRLRARRSSSSATARWPSSVRDVVDRALRGRRRARARARRHPRRHEVRVRPRRRRRARRSATRCCTPDSSRFWPADDYEAGHGQPSFDKQYVRDWAAGTGWDKHAARAGDPRRRRRRARASATSRPTSASPASRSTPGWSGPPP